MVMRKKTEYLKAGVFFLLLFLVWTGPRLEGGVYLDPSFSTNGIAQHNNAAGGNGDDWGRAVTLDKNGRILVAGASTGPANPEMTVWCFLTNGLLDTAFSNKGWVIQGNAAGGNGQDWGRGIAVDRSNRILVTGYSFSGTSDDMVLWRFRSDGSLDTSFSNKGWVVHHNAAGGNGGEWGYSVKADTNGKIVVAGFSHNGANNDMVVWRYNPDGSLDTAFSNKGWVVHDNAAGGSGNEEAYAVTIDRNNKIVAVGYSYNGKDTDLAVWRFNPDGSLDTTFSNKGFVVHNGAAGGNTNDSGREVAIDANNRIVVAGYSGGPGTGDDIVVWRFNPDGSLDTAFNGQGWVAHNNAAGGPLTGNDRARAMTLDPLGRILVGGFSHTGFNYDMIVWRFLENGALDTSFSNTGWVINKNAAGAGGAEDYCYGITADSAGRIFCTGESDNSSGNQDVIVWCYRSPIAVSTNTNGGAAGPDLSAIESMGDVVLAPNPFRPFSGEKDKEVRFYNLGGSFDLTVFSFTGRVVYSRSGVSSSGVFAWDVRDQEGRPLKSGTYFCRLSDPSGREQVLKLVVIR